MFLILDFYLFLHFSVHLEYILDWKLLINHDLFGKNRDFMHKFVRAHA